MPRSIASGGGSGWVLLPPIQKDEAEREFGRPILDSAWREICDAFSRHGMRLDNLDGTFDNKNKNDKQGWHRRKTDAEKGIEAALAGLKKINRDFLVEAEENVSLDKTGGLESYKSEKRLNKAFDEILLLSWIVREAKPISREVMTKTESRRQLAYDVYQALKDFGASTSDGWKMAESEPSYADLTGFEKLIETLQIHEGETPRAISKWCREALARKR